MNQPGGKDRAKRDESFRADVVKKAERKIKSRKEKELKSVWFGLGTFGMVGWAVAVPTLIMTAIGIWLDTSAESGISWTLTGVFTGVILGSLNAWYWVSKESKHD
ncbi:MAG: ATP synthase subunit [candidate division Zixibacteria bacterium]|nr:ATP synthase subunit [candidate division Zixibacteria bacterium]